MLINSVMLDNYFHISKSNCLVMFTMFIMFMVGFAIGSLSLNDIPQSIQDQLPPTLGTYSAITLWNMSSTIKQINDTVKEVTVTFLRDSTADINIPETMYFVINTEANGIVTPIAIYTSTQWNYIAGA